MKKYVFFLFLTIYCLTAFSQNDDFVRPAAGFHDIKLKDSLIKSSNIISGSLYKMTSPSNGQMCKIRENPFPAHQQKKYPGNTSEPADHMPVYSPRENSGIMIFLPDRKFRYL